LNARGPHYAGNDGGQALKCVVSVLTVGQLVCLYKYYRFQIDMDSVEKYTYERRRIPLCRSTRVWPFLAECCALLLHAPPYMDFRATFAGHDFDHIIDDKLSLFVLFRIYMFVRLVREYSDSYRWRKWIIESGRMDYG
jgi:hypothetical protein